MSILRLVRGVLGCSRYSGSRAGAPQGGQSQVEFALTLPLLMLLLLGALDLGRAFSAYVAVTNAARESARYGASHPKDTSDIVARAVQEAAGSGITLSVSDIQVDCAPYTGGSFSSAYCTQPPTNGDQLRVTVNHQFELVTLYLFHLPTISMTNFTIMPVLNGNRPL